jgi:hypothetical protein
MAVFCHLLGIVGAGHISPPEGELAGIRPDAPRSDDRPQVSSELSIVRAHLLPAKRARIDGLVASSLSRRQVRPTPSLQLLLARHMLLLAPNLPCRECAAHAPPIATRESSTTLSYFGTDSSMSRRSEQRAGTENAPRHRSHERDDTSSLDALAESLRRRFRSGRLGLLAIARRRWR